MSGSSSWQGAAIRDDTSGASTVEMPGAAPRASTRRRDHGIGAVQTHLAPVDGTSAAKAKAASAFGTGTRLRPAQHIAVRGNQHGHVDRQRAEAELVAVQQSGLKLIAPPAATVRRPSDRRARSPASIRAVRPSAANGKRCPGGTAPAYRPSAACAGGGSSAEADQRDRMAPPQQLAAQLFVNVQTPPTVSVGQQDAHASSWSLLQALASVSGLCSWMSLQPCCEKMKVVRVRALPRLLVGLRAKGCHILRAAGKREHRHGLGDPDAMRLQVRLPGRHLRRIVLRHLDQVGLHPRDALRAHRSAAP